MSVSSKSSPELHKWAWVSVSVVVHALILASAVLMPENSVEFNPLSAVDTVELVEEKTEPIAPLAIAAPAVAAPQAVAKTPPAVPKSEPRAAEPAPTPAPPSEFAAAAPVSTKGDEGAGEPKPEAIAAKAPADSDRSPPAYEKAQPADITSAAPIKAPPTKIIEDPIVLDKEKPSGGGTADKPGDGEELKPLNPNGSGLPEYPEEDRKAGREGKVNLRFLVDDTGSVSQVAIHQNTGSRQMGLNAQAYLQAMKFSARQKGWWEKEFSFSLAGDPIVYGGQLRQ